MEDRQNCSISTKYFACSVCSKPLRHPIFQCSAGHFFCHNCGNDTSDPDIVCPVCRDTDVSQCYGMESAVRSIVVDCANAELGCTEKMTYFDKEEHEKACPHARFPCPAAAVAGCGFAGRSEELLAHCVSVTHLEGHGHQATFSYFRPFDLHVEPGPDWYLLRSRNDRQLFVLNVEPAVPPFGRPAVSLVCVRAGAAESKCGCSLSFFCFQGHHGSANLYSLPCSTLSDGLPKDDFCVLPYAPSDQGQSVVLRVTIDKEMDYDGVEDLEDDDDGSYHEDEDDDQDQLHADD